MTPAFIEKPFISANKYSMNTLYLGSTHYIYNYAVFAALVLDTGSTQFHYFLIIGTLTNKRRNENQARRESSSHRGGTMKEEGNGKIRYAESDRGLGKERRKLQFSGDFSLMAYGSL